MGRQTAQGRSPSHAYAIGLWAEGLFLAHAGERGWWAYKGLQGHEPCDFIVIMDDDTLARVEVRGSVSAQRRDNTNYHAVLSKLDRQKFDFLFVATPDGCFWIPRHAIGASGQLAIGVERVGGSRNKWWEYKVA